MPYVFDNHQFVDCYLLYVPYGVFSKLDYTKAGVEKPTRHSLSRAWFWLLLELEKWVWTPFSSPSFLRWVRWRWERLWLHSKHFNCVFWLLLDEVGVMPPGFAGTFYLNSGSLQNIFWLVIDSHETLSGNIHIKITKKQWLCAPNTTLYDT